MLKLDEPSNGNNTVRINLNHQHTDEQDAQNARADADYTRTITVDNCSDQEDVCDAEQDQNEFSRRKNDPHPQNLGHKQAADTYNDQYGRSKGNQGAQLMDQASHVTDQEALQELVTPNVSFTS